MTPGEGARVASQPAASLPQEPQARDPQRWGLPDPHKDPEESVTPGRHQQQLQGTVQGALLPLRPPSTLLAPGGWGRETR